MNKGIVLGIVFLLVFMSFTSICGNQISNQIIKSFDKGNILYVGGSGEGNYSRIQDAIDNASDGDTVFVYNDSSPYWESVVVDKSINLLGENRDTTSVYGEFNISADWVNISGFNFEYYGIVINSKYNTIIGNNLQYTDICININSNYNIINGNNIQSWGIGIKIDSYYNSIVDNNISEFDWYGIYLSSTSKGNSILWNNITSRGYDYPSGIELVSSNNNIILGNTISDNGYGIWLDSSKKNIIEQNNFSGNSNCIYLKSSFENTVNNNTLIDNAHGIMLRYSNNNTIIGNYKYPYVGCTSFSLSSSHNNTIGNNTIYRGSDINLYNSNNNVIYGNTVSNSWGGLTLVNASNNTIFCNNFVSNRNNGISCIPDYNANYERYLMDTKCCNLYKNILMNPNTDTSVNGSYNIIYHNNFINNTQNAYDECNNTWDDGYPSGGNYWDDYTGEDNDGDGIGDTPYNISGGDNDDRYPLMEPWGGNHPPEAPIINGPAQGKPGVEYDYTFVTTDPEEDDVWYHISWGDKEIIYIYGPYPSGEEITLSYNWSEKGTFIITCWARDIFDAVSNTTTFEVTIPRNKAVTSNMLLLRILERFPLLERLYYLFGM